MSTITSSVLNQPTTNNLQIMEFFIFNRMGVCLVHIDLQEDQLIVTNKALNLSADRKLEDRYKLIFGLLFSMKSFVKNLSPNKTFDFFKSYLSSKYKLHYIELLNGLRFVALTTPIKADLNPYLKEIFSAFYVNFISKNIFLNKDEPIRSDIFLELVFNYLTNLNQNIN